MTMKLLLPAPEESDGSAWYATPASTSFPAHCHDELELNLVVRGEAHYFVEGNTVRVPAGSMIWLFPGRLHELLHVSADWTMWVFAFRWRLVERVIPGPAAWSLADEVSAPTSPTTAEQARTIARLGYDVISKRDVAAGNRALCEVLRTAWSTRPTRELSPQVHPAVVEAARLARDIDFRGSAGALARRCAISTTRLSHLFSDQIGVPLVHYRNHFRVQAFIRSFGDGTELGMLSSALDVGFGSYAQFHRAFHQVTGYGPRRHLERVRAGVIRP
jgi:methylphosphotriester-DNA--protein-cysteine methyltransferase